MVEAEVSAIPPMRPSMEMLQMDVEEDAQFVLVKERRNVRRRKASGGRGDIP